MSASKMSKLKALVKEYRKTHDLFAEKLLLSAQTLPIAEFRTVCLEMQELSNRKSIIMNDIFSLIEAP